MKQKDCVETKDVKENFMIISTKYRGKNGDKEK